ncbi:chronophin-like [Cydia strobilella]|uniref:chronophin-like n=1 Tax=Cydia strobilella TaxID=1100964 RepID=UPI00300545AD
MAAIYMRMLGYTVTLTMHIINTYVLTSFLQGPVMEDPNIRTFTAMYKRFFTVWTTCLQILVASLGLTSDYLMLKYSKKKEQEPDWLRVMRSTKNRLFAAVLWPTVFPDVCHKFLDNFADFTQYLIDDADIGAVAFDSDYKVNLPKMYKAATYLRRPEVHFMNGPTDKFVPVKGQMTIGVAFAAELVSELVNREPIGLGKPSKNFGVLGMRRAGVTDPSRVLFIGDTLEQDVRLGKNTGFKTLLVLTQHSEQVMMAEPVALQPDFFAPSLGTIVPKFTKLVKN